MAEHLTRRRGPRGRRPKRAAVHHFSQEVADLGATTARLPRPMCRELIQWLRQLLALLRFAPAGPPPDRQAGRRAEPGRDCEAG